MTAAYAARIRRLREAACLAPEDVADAIGINHSWYGDLEGFDDELESTLELRQVALLAAALRVTLRYLLAPDDRAEDAATRPRVSFADLVSRLQDAVQQHGLNKVEDRVGWGLTGFLERGDPRQWPLDFLKDVCEYVKVDWFDAVPDELRP